MPRGSKTGQFPFAPSEEQRTLVMALAAAGVPQETIVLQVRHADGAPIDKKTLRKHFRRELDNGMQEANGAVIKTAYEMITKDRNPALTIFWLKTRLGWKEPAQEVNLSMTYGQLVEQMHKKAEEERLAKLTLIPGGKAA